MSSQSPGRCPIRVALVGCGALSERYYAPALEGLKVVEPLQVTALVDPSPSRIEVLARLFPEASRFGCVTDLPSGGADVAIVATPQKLHAEHSIALLNSGLHVLCEKPMASSLEEARAMVDAARQAGRLLAVGLFRRFFPTSQMVGDLMVNGALGRPISFEWKEGGPFNWPAASASFFQKGASRGGVFADLGAHILDLLLLWFGEPQEFGYEDDAMGGIEANCRLSLRFEGGIAGTVRLSRDTVIPNGTRIVFERGSIWFEGGSADSVAIQLNGCCHVAQASLHEQPDARAMPGAGFGSAARTYCQSFMAQIRNFCRAVRGDESLRVPGDGALAAIELIERCYASRRIMRLPWLTDEEREEGLRLAGATVLSAG